MRRSFENINLTPAQAGYLAGILDGEGWISIASQMDRRRPSGMDRYYYVLVGVTNTHRPLLDWIYEVTQRGNVQKGTIGSSYGRKPRWQWICRGWSAADVIRAAEPYLIEKRKRAHLALEFSMARDRNYSNGHRTLPESARAEYAEIYKRFKAL